MGVYLQKIHIQLLYINLYVISRGWGKEFEFFMKSGAGDAASCGFFVRQSRQIGAPSHPLARYAKGWGTSVPTLRDAIFSFHHFGFCHLSRFIFAEFMGNRGDIQPKFCPTERPVDNNFRKI
ncbi:MAG: hypothetical protein IJC15_01160 [Clostridia bacterium]|nr:hypothetical protein [Clostridia bacterium]